MKKGLLLLSLVAALELALLLLVFNQPAQAIPTDVQVNRATGVDQVGCGTTIMPCYSIKYAMENVVGSGDTVVVSAGTYTETFDMKSGVVIVSESGPELTIIDGEGVRGPMVSASSATITESAQLEGFTVTGSNNRGIAIGYASPVISNCIISENSGGWGGGIGIWEAPADVLISHSRIISNTASGDGAGIWVVDDAALTLVHSTVTSNTAGLWAGGVLGNGAASLTISDTLVQENNSKHGGGVMVNDCDLNLFGSEFYSNTSTSGAGVYVSGSAGTVANNTIQGNVSSGGGGGILVQGDSDLTVAHNDISGNSAVLFGSGMVIEDGASVIAEYNRIAGNIGDGIYVSNGIGTIENNLIIQNIPDDEYATQLKIRGTSVFTVTNNTIVGDGIATGIRIEEGAMATITNNIVSGNEYGIRTVAPVTTTLATNVLWDNSVANYQDITPGANDVSCDPDFVDAANGDWHLDICSCAVDMGTNIGAPAYDYDGNMRSVDGNDDGTATVDIGAYERLTVTAPLPVSGFTYDISGLVVTFTNTSSNAVSYAWDFGDGIGTSIAVSPVYTYTLPGDYTATLTAMCSFGCEVSYQSIIEVRQHTIFLPQMLREP